MIHVSEKVKDKTYSSYLEMIFTYDCGSKYSIFLFEDVFKTL